MHWRKSPQELIDTFEAVLPGPPARPRKMFGFPAGFVGGRLFMGLHQESMLLRLPEDLRAKLLKIDGARIFEPMPGRPMREYVVVPPSLITNRDRLVDWVTKAFEYGASLEPKSTTKKSKPKKSKTRKKSQPAANR